MQASLRTMTNLVGTAVLTLSIAGAALAGDFVGLDSFTGQYYGIDTATNTATNLGPIAGAPPFGFAQMDRSSDGQLYATAPGLLNGYTIYSIDEQTLTASPLYTISTNSSGGVGLAVEPGGGAVWVAGFVQLSLIVKVQRVDLANGLMTEQGQAAGNLWGLAFDSAGNLYSSTQGAMDPELVLIDKIDAANATIVGPMAGVDMNFGLDLASDVSNGSVHAFSRATGSLYSVDTSTGAATLVSNLTGASSIFTIADAGCTLVTSYGAGCPGSGSFVPALAFNGCPAPSAFISVEVADGLGGAPCVLLFGNGQASLPVGGGCTLLLSGVSPFSLLLSLGGAGAGNGVVVLPATLPASLPSVTFTMQAFVGDNASSTGYSASNGVEIIFP